MTRERRLDFDPAEEAARDELRLAGDHDPTDRAIATRLEIAFDDLEPYRNRGAERSTCDAMAVALNVNPVALWGNDWGIE